MPRGLEWPLSVLAEHGLELDDEGPDEDFGHHDEPDGDFLEHEPEYGEGDPLDTYLDQVHQTPPLSTQDQIRLSRAVAAGQQAERFLRQRHDVHLPRTVREQAKALCRDGQIAQDELVRANLRLVVSIARRHSWADGIVELADRVQDGNCGLLQAASKFDATLGHKFATYASALISREIRRGTADRGRTIRLPVHVQQQLTSLRAERLRSAAESGRPDSLPELGGRLDMADGKGLRLLEHSRPVASLDCPLRDGDEDLGQLLVADQDLELGRDPLTVVLMAEQSESVWSALNVCLTAEDREVLVRRFGLNGEAPMTVIEIARTLNLSQARIRQIESRSLATLRAGATGSRLYGLLQNGDSPSVVPMVKTPRKQGAGVAQAGGVPADPVPPPAPAAIATTLRWLGASVNPSIAEARAAATQPSWNLQCPRIASA